MGDAPPVAMRLAVVGGGWAGLSAAVTALRRGFDVTVFEASARLGGRARTSSAPSLGCDIDNGQHLLLGAYESTLSLMRDLGLDPNRLFRRLPLNVLSADGRVTMRARTGLPAPLHIAAGLLNARGLHIKEKSAAIRAILALRWKRWNTPAGMTVQEWLDTTGQPPRLQHLLWHPLCIATMNTPAQIACAQLFSNVLRDSVGARNASASDMLIPRTTLSELWPEHVALIADGMRVLRSSPVRRLSRRPSGAWAVDNHAADFDAVLLCCNTPSTHRLLSLLPACTGSNAFLETLRRFEHAPIATLTLRFAEPLHLRSPMLMLHEDRSRAHFGQWLFQGQDPDGRLAHVVISDAADLSAAGRAAAVAGVTQQLREQLSPAKLPLTDAQALIVEKRATFLAVPGLKRPGNDTPWTGLWVAGDWTDTGYPAVLEGAVRSGRDAALRMAQHFQGASDSCSGACSRM